MLATFTVGVPVAIAGGAALAVRRRPDGHQFDRAVAATAAFGSLATLLLGRLGTAVGVGASPVLLGGAAVLAIWLLTLASGRVVVIRPGLPMGVALGTGILAALTVTSDGWERPTVLLVAVPLAGLLLLTILVKPARPRARWAGLALDAGLAALLFLLVADVTVHLKSLPFNPYDPALTGRHFGSPAAMTALMQYHHDYYLGPANDLLHGRAMLVDTFSPYGVGLFYFLAAFFTVAPIGYGTLGLLAGVLMALQCVAGWAVLRLAGCRRMLAAVAMGAAVIGTVFPFYFSPAAFPSGGGIRFGLCWLLVLLAVGGARWPAGERMLRIMGAAVVAVASIWSLETFLAALATFTAGAALGALAFGGSRVTIVRRLGADLLRTLLGCLIAHAAFALATRVLAGSWPDWAGYFAHFQIYTLHGQGQLPIAAWSPGLALAGLYFASTVGLAVLVTRRNVLCAHRAALTATAVLTALGLAALMYFWGQSSASTLLPASLPGIVLAAVWASILADGSLGLGHWPRRMAVLAACWVAALAMIPGWDSTVHKWPRSALSHALPGEGLRSSLEGLWRSPPIDPRAEEGRRLLDRPDARARSPVVLTSNDLTVETLIRADRANALPLTVPVEDALVPRRSVPRIDSAVERLPAGSIMLLEDRPMRPGAFYPIRLTPLQREALNRIGARFRLQELARTPSGLALYRLLPRS